MNMHNHNYAENTKLLVLNSTNMNFQLESLSFYFKMKYYIFFLHKFMV